MIGRNYQTMNGAKTIADAEKFYIDTKTPLAAHEVLSQVIVNLSGARGEDAKLIRTACKDFSDRVDGGALAGLIILDEALQ